MTTTETTTFDYTTDASGNKVITKTTIKTVVETKPIDTKMILFNRFKVVIQKIKDKQIAGVGVELEILQEHLPEIDVYFKDKDPNETYEYDEDILEFIEDRTEFKLNDIITFNEFKDAVKSWYKYYDKGRYNMKEIIKCMDSKYTNCNVSNIYWYDCRLKPLPKRPMTTPFYG